MASASLQTPALSSRLGQNIPNMSFRPTCAHHTSIALKPEKWPQHKNKGRAAYLKRTNIWRPLCVRRPLEPGEPHFLKNSTHSPLSDAVLEFYSSINDKDLNKLEQLISDDCVFEDLTYFKPLERKKIRHFFKRLTGAMGKHVSFVIDRVLEGKELNVAVTWHLEWNNEFIPFSKGCSFYKCSKKGEQEARVFVESPMKPGDLALEMLKIIISLFDKFPKLAESFLQKPDAMVLLLQKIYKWLIEPMIFPFLVYYTHVWRYVVRGLSYVLNMLQKILKLFI
ncbi:putative Nuclear transport factor 2 (NTF2) family protein [Cocos nucifera]|uniref:Putative Nuclear transport factor 2 (NTF2) family protein n=1 Tax=Cocos nucifera TaxID=13894 RepID=A0A8K0IFI3_COCNU|nr:putative Nuclear transport factor 2 (NTF2) family protein [Cocos nucifera]